jgi:hypothetical protein
METDPLTGTRDKILTFIALLSEMIFLNAARI